MPDNPTAKTTSSASRTKPRRWVSMMMTCDDEGSDTYIGVDTDGHAFRGYCSWKDGTISAWRWHEIPLPSFRGGK